MRVNSFYYALTSSLAFTNALASDWGQWQPNSAQASSSSSSTQSISSKPGNSNGHTSSSVTVSQRTKSSSSSSSSSTGYSQGGGYPHGGGSQNGGYPQNGGGSQNGGYSSGGGSPNGGGSQSGGYTHGGGSSNGGSSQMGGNGGSGIDKPWHTHAPVSYSGPGVTGTAGLPASISAVVFPTNSAQIPFPHFGSGKLGQNALSQGKTNGDSKLGTLDIRNLPPFVGSSASGSDTSGAPWGGKTANNTNPYTSPPNTGVVRSYHFTIARGTMAPDGVQREVLVVNNQFPGPLIEANWGDTVEITVTNAITGPEEGTALHWHGMLQKNTGYEDGVPGVTQCPIAPGESFTYSFQADLYGTSWWHSHFSAQYAGGALGPMVIHGPDNAGYDQDLGPILLTDYYHGDYFSILENVMGTDLSKIAAFSQNNLINGKGNYNCSLVTDNTTCTENAGLSKFQFKSGQTHRLRLINGGAEAIQRFSIDNHELEVIAYDFVPIVPYTTKSVTLGIGQRADVLVKANGNSSSSSYWMRSTISSACSLAEQTKGLAIIYYENANTTAEPTSTGWTVDDSTCQNDPLPGVVPYFPIKPPTVNTTVNVALSFEVNSTGNFLWTMDGSSFRTDYNNPILPLLQADNSSASIAEFPREWNVYNFGQNKSFIIVINNQNPIAHPMHIHGHNMFVLSEGIGSWDGTTQGDSNNPTRRDVQLIPPSGHIAIQIDADNPGIWPLHCHIAWHVSGGLYINMLERPNDIPKMVKSPDSCGALCDKWNAFTSTGSVDQIDSGLRRRSYEAPILRKRDHLRRHAHAHIDHRL